MYMLLELDESQVVLALGTFESALEYVNAHPAIR